MSAASLLLFFIDGVGLGDDAAYNPFTHARLPVLTALLGGALPLAGQAPLPLAGQAGEASQTGAGHAYRGVGAHSPHARASLHALDATCGVEGLPQSGTGQAALFTGADAVALHGRHFGPWVPTTLRTMLRAQNLLVRAQQAGRSVAFANAYPEELVARAQENARRVPAFLRAGPPIVALAAGLLTRHTGHLARGDAVASEITNDGWRERLMRDVPAISAESAGANLARIVAAHDLTLYAHYATDTAGHLRELEPAVAALERVDAFLRGLLDHVPPAATIVIASDHGNIEDVRAQHTRNPALGMVIGASGDDARMTSIMDVAPWMLHRLGVEE